MSVEKIISGGQTGADRGGLDAALFLGLSHGGACPAGRRAEDGRIPERYHLEETPERDYAVRTERNVLAADATVLFTYGEPTGGSALTASLTRRHGRPLLHVDLSRNDERWAGRFIDFCAEHGVRVLNVAGSRESGAPGLQRRVQFFLVAALGGRLGASG
ncbi:MAG: putative molybdenum carrier protein [Deltaproteobacteria bacterium]|nr:putative molybdenum carrier protein [Deltaproteobacteria bacterium]